MNSSAAWPIAWWYPTIRRASPPQIDHDPAKRNSIVVIGSGLTGYTLIRQLHQHDATRPVVLIIADGGEVYTKLLLSNALAKAETPDILIQKSAEARAQELNVVLTSRGGFAWSDLVLATGASQRIIWPDNAERDWIDTVNDLMAIVACTTDWAAAYAACC